MRGVFRTGNRGIEVRELPDPTPGPGEVVIDMRAAAVCGSDLHGFRQPPEAMGPRLHTIAGHEPSGVVSALGPGVSGIVEGDRVTVNHHVGCGHCRYCRVSSYNRCPRRQALGRQLHGADADRMAVAARNCLPLPEGLTFLDGMFIACIGGTAYSAMRKLGPSGDSTVAVFGLGPVGLTGVVMAKAMGARVIGVEPSAERRALAGRLGADEVIDPTADEAAGTLRELTDGQGYDLAFETSGNGAGQQAAVQGARTGGKVAFVGFGNRANSISPSQFIDRELTLMGSYVLPVALYWDLTAFIERHRLDLGAVVTHRFGVEQGAEAFATADAGASGKVMFEWA